jgi:HD-GYP domain-containing protein (c-di-GMP phosphodiesterase class II)
MGRADPAFRRRVVNVGSGVSIGLGTAGFIYAALTWEQPHRMALAAICVAAAFDGTVIYLLRREIASSPLAERVFFAWNVSHVIAACVACYLDGGPASPFVMVLFVSIAFAAVSLARLYVWAVALVDLATLLVLAETTDQWHAGLIPLGAALVAVGFVGAAVAGEQHSRLIAVQEARTEMLQRLARVIEFRDLETGAHVERMAEYCALIARKLGWNEEEIARLRAAAPMHDVGKVAVPDEILLKPGPLTPEERRIMERHTVVGHEMLVGSSTAEIELGAVIALTHHEHFDGGGYPQGLSGSDIPTAGRIVAVADVFDALTTDRVYRDAMPVADALRILHDGRARQFDPKVLDAFDAALDDILSVRSRHSDRGRVADIRSARSLESVRG